MQWCMSEIEMLWVYMCKTAWRGDWREKEKAGELFFFVCFFLFFFVCLCFFGAVVVVVVFFWVGGGEGRRGIF